jgi:hypothetical protein
METGHTYINIPRSRIATFDTFSIGFEKHHVTALPEFDVTESRKKLQEMRRSRINISFKNWLKKVVCDVIALFFYLLPD